MLVVCFLENGLTTSLIYKEDGVCPDVRYARPHLCMDFFPFLHTDASASKLTPKLGFDFKKEVVYFKTNK